MTRRRAWLGVLILIGACVPNPNFEGSGDDGTSTEDGTAPSVPTCGDGIVDEGEDCDDGNTSNNDACLNDCRAASCRDGHVWQGHEQCDDGNSNHADACLNSCMTATCGDGLIQQGVESCDDGNTSNTDACTSTCEFAICGDGFLRQGIEICDDGNAEDTDACLSTCEHASCGDGFIHVGIEACDDGNVSDDDGCSSACEIEQNIVFVTSLDSPGGFEGLEGANLACQDFAGWANLPGQYRAWLSSGNETPLTQFTKSDRAYVLVDGTVIANDWADLTDGDLLAPINLTESGQEITGYAWTGTTASGDLGAPEHTCSNWSDGTNFYNGHVGKIDAATADWSFYSNGSCSSLHHIYCFRQLP